MNRPDIYKSTAGKSLILQEYDQILRRWPIEYQPLVVSTHLGETHILACGDPGSPPLILLHGSSSNASMWIADISDFSQFYRVYAPDIPGEPGKSEPVRPSLDSNAYALWLQEIFSVLEIQSADLVGISLGGWLAIKFASEYPNKINHLVLLCPAGLAPQKSSFIFWALLLLPFGRRGKEQLMYLLNGKQELALEAVQYSCLIAENFNPRLEIVPLFSDEELRRIFMPVLLIAGEKDILLPSELTADRLLRCVPQAEVDLRVESGHILVGFSNRILSFLTT